MLPMVRAVRLCLALCLFLSTFRPALAADDPGDALRRAASAGDLAKVQEALASGVDVNAANRYGGTALAFACDKGHTAVVNLLLERGANPNVKDSFYNATPLSWAVQKGHADIVRALLAKGAEGETEALIGAAAEGAADVVKVILERGKAGPEALTDALAAATRGQHAAIVAQLEAAGAKPMATVTLDPAVLKSYEGTFEGPEFGVTVTVQENKLVVAAIGGGGALTFSAVDPVSFRAEEVPGIKIKFQVENGKVAGLDFDQRGRSFPLKKKETP